MKFQQFYHRKVKPSVAIDTAELSRKHGRSYNAKMVLQIISFSQRYSQNKWLRTVFTARNRIVRWMHHFFINIFLD